MAGASDFSHNVFPLARPRSSCNNHPLASNHGAPVGPLCALSPPRSFIASAGQRPSLIATGSPGAFQSTSFQDRHATSDGQVSF